MRDEHLQRTLRALAEVGRAMANDYQAQIQSARKLVLREEEGGNVESARSWRMIEQAAQRLHGLWLAVAEAADEPEEQEK